MISMKGDAMIKATALTRMSIARFNTAAGPRRRLRRMPISGRPSIASTAARVLITSSRS
ncbi:MAG: hypothetical protein QOJ33_2624, partial [Chloroflexota bacterium]|nr:hypothetical protein [Chloroflexota bacterium]